MPRESHINALRKLAYGTQLPCATVGYRNPIPTVGDVLSSIGVAQARDIGSPDERRDAFGRIVSSGLVNSSPAGKALRMLGGGALGRFITGAFTNNQIIKGVGTGIGALVAIRD